jgi:hypothetical protein
VVLSVHEMKFAPLLHSQRPKNRVIGDRFGVAKALLAFANDFFHACQVLHDFNHYLVQRQGAREHTLRRLATLRKEPESGNEEPLPSLAASVRTGDRLSPVRHL